jgi:sugar phosphate isomerase/epimerase
LLDATTREVPGDGVAPLVRMLQVLHRKGYSGPLSVELFLPRMQQGDPYQAAMEIQKKSVPILRQAGVL